MDPKELCGRPNGYKTTEIKKMFVCLMKENDVNLLCLKIIAI